MVGRTTVAYPHGVVESMVFDSPWCLASLHQYPRLILDAAYSALNHTVLSLGVRGRLTDSGVCAREDFSGLRGPEAVRVGLEYSYLVSAPPGFP